VGKNQTFNSIIGGGGNADGGMDNNARKRARRDQINHRRANKRAERYNKDKEENSTEQIYEKIKTELGKDWNRGYSTEENDDSAEDINVPIEEEEVNDEVNMQELDKEELLQLELEDAIRPRKYVLSARS